ncbi:hypothetical protein [Pseudogemmobacter faecipullorum]|uniref:Uncharacterized protein n=1 Tax=Pseudogemmobacter faecipullorum TaxID=2755041 RepID=A0ABS8CJF2_9RHOB|nr:hypothetical protein [Pseudogemmobacter faecipullorum]MCB5409517.1 hypothetical protein [Pseudogemmobacter faecipullorum]
MKPLFSALALALTLPLAAEARTWTPPQGCEIFLTVQSQGCRVSNHYICSADPAGDQWRADFDQEGLYFRSRINAETEWVESFEMNPPQRQWLDAGRADPASFSELLATGLDTFEFTLSRDSGIGSRVTGFDRLTGNSITVDGFLLEETEYEALEEHESGEVRGNRGHEYISRELRLFFSGAGQMDLGDGEWLPYSGAPLDILKPGEKGFGATQPLYDCDPLMTEAPGNPAIIRARYDG